MTPLSAYLVLSGLLFSIGLGGALTRRNAIIVLIGIELMLNAANLNFMAFWRYSEHPEALTGVMFVIFSIGVAAAEAAALQDNEFRRSGFNEGMSGSGCDAGRRYGKTCKTETEFVIHGRH